MRDPRAAVRHGWARTRLVYHTVSDLGLRTTGQVIVHSWRRRRLGKGEWAGRTPPGAMLEPGELKDVTPIAGGARLAFSGAELEVVLVADDVIRFTWGPGDDLLPYAAQVPGEWRQPSVSVHTDSGGCALRGDGVEVRVSSVGEITLMGSQGSVLRHELVPRRRGTWWEHRFRVRAGERFSGLGEQAAGVDLSGGSFRLWNRDPGGAWGAGQMSLYMGIPVVVASHPEGDLLSFYDNPSSADVRFPSSVSFSGGDEDGDRDEGEVSVRFAGGALRYYVVIGDLPTLLDRYSELTGRPALPPRWALGYHQSRWGYRNERHVFSVLDGYRNMGLPLSAVHLDIDYMDGYRVFTVDRRRFPDLEALTARAAGQGVRLVSIVDPAVKVDRNYALYRQGIEKKLFCTVPDGDPQVGVVWPGRAVFPDFTSPATRRWWAAQYRTLTDAGVGGMWHDMNEPTSISLVGDPTLPLDTRHDVEGRGGVHAQVHNLYGMLMNQAGHQGLVEARPERRPFVVSRSGWAGNQRWAWNWTGDVESSWAGLRQQIATIVGLGLSGIPFSGSDIGGFSGVPDAELYLRWLQMAVFTPFCRTHSVVGVPRREPWRFPEPARSAIAAWIRLRYRLLPYLYTLAFAAAESGTPLMRPLWWPAPGDCGSGGGGRSIEVPDPGDADDTFLLGDALLVAPVTAPGSRARRVWLPPGIWHPWWAADEGRDCSASLVAGAPIERIPVFVRAGSVMALDDGFAQPRSAWALDGDDQLEGLPPAPGTCDLNHTPGLLSIHCWPSEGAAEGHVVDDAGDGDGPCRRDRFRLSGASPGGTAILRWEREGEFPAPERIRVVVHGLLATRAVADGRTIEVRGGSVRCGPFDELRLEGLQAG